VTRESAARWRLIVLLVAALILFLMIGII